jgi:hypothetical protein
MDNTNIQENNNIQKEFKTMLSKEYNIPEISERTTLKNYRKKRILKNKVAKLSRKINRR